MTLIPNQATLDHDVRVPIVAPPLHVGIEEPDAFDGDCSSAFEPDISDMPQDFGGTSSFLNQIKYGWSLRLHFFF